MSRCSDTAYATLLSTHASHIGARTFLADPARGHHGTHSANDIRPTPIPQSFFLGLNEDLRSRQMQVLLVLVRSLRSLEKCRRDFILMLGNRTHLADTHREMLAREDVIFHSTPVLFEGVPTADKFEAWRLTKYRRVVVLDSDVMALKPLDDLFEMPEQFVIAHHPYDQLQAQCGIAPANRGIAAMFVMSPNLTTYSELLLYVRRRFTLSQLTYSDQTGLVCFFANRTRTLPCSYLYEPANPLYSPGIRRYMKECRMYGKQNVLRNCLAGSPDGCASWNPATACEEVRQNLQTRCLWPNVYSEVHAVHFKGKSKPWPSMQQRTMACRHLRIGLPVVFTNARSGRHVLASAPIQLEPADLLEWNTSALACVSSRFRQTVHWAGAQCKAANTGQCGGSFPVQHRKCCNFGMNLAAKWHQYLAAAPPR